MNRKLLLPVMAAAGVIGAGFLFAQTADDENEGSTLERDEPNEIWRFKWWGKTGRTYFIQHSEDLMLWNWVPVVESGNDAVKEWGFTSTSDKFFLRLRYTDTPSNDPENDDFDLDGVANLAEVMQGSNPFSWEDTDNDGLPDDWEIHHFGNLDYNGTHDPDGDGLTNLQEFIYHTDPMDFGNLATNPLQDGDGNGLPDWWEILNFGTLGNNPNQTVAANGGLTLQQIYDNDLELGVAATLGDGVPDAWKIANGLSTTDPNVANEDPDTDGLTNAEEYEARTNPNNAYSDSDAIKDGSDLYPLVADPTTPTSFYVAVPSWEEQSNSPAPDWSAVDHTTVELRWEASSNGPANYIIERRADNDLWQAIATVSGGETTYEDDGLVANRHYQYRIRATKTEGATQVSSAFATANYRVPLNLRLHAKTASSSQSKWNYGIREFTTPSTPPKYYLTKTDIWSYTQSSSSSGYSSSGSGSYSFTRTADPMLKKVEETGTYSTQSQSNSWWEGGSSSSTSSASSDYSGLDQARSPGVPTATTQRSFSSDSDSSSSSLPGNSSSSSSWSDGSYLLQGTYSPTGGPALWTGSDFDMSRGTVSFAGSSSSSSSYTSSWGSNSNSSASATATGTGSPSWSGTSTNSSGQSSSISEPASYGYWYQYGWFYGLQSTTPTSRSYSSTSGSTQYQGTQTLSNEYSTEALIATTIAHMSDYQPEWIEDYWGWGYYDWGYWGPYDYWGYDDWYYYYGYGYYWWGWGTAQWNLSTDEASFSTGKFKYKFSANPSAPTTMRWAEIFVPYDDYNTPEVNESLDIEVVAERTWQLTGSENESPEFEIDPTQNPPTRNGYYTILFRPVSVSVPGLGEAGKDKTGQDTEPGKVVLINDGDADNDGIPDYADGYNLHSGIEADDTVPGASFIPIHVGFYAIDPENVKIKFTYPASNPTAVTTTSTNPFQLPTTGKIRLWMKDANGGWVYDPATGNAEFSQRDGRSVSQGGDFIEPGVEYRLEDLGLADDYYYYYQNGFTVYAEVVKTSDAVADIPVKVEIKPNANLGFVFSDQVRFTGSKIELMGRDYQRQEWAIVKSFVGSRTTTLDEDIDAFGVTPGAYKTYKVHISDPRSSLIQWVRIAGQNIEMTRVGSQWQSNEFIALPSGFFNPAQSVPSQHVFIGAGNATLEYNAEGIWASIVSAIRDSQHAKEVFKQVRIASQQLVATGWVPNTANNGGEFGTKIHELVGLHFKDNGNSKWVVDVYVDQTTNKVLSIGTAPGTGSYTQIDLMRVRKGYVPIIDSVIDPKHVIEVFDIKTAARIKMTEELKNQISRINQAVGFPTGRTVKLVPSEYCWSSLQSRIIVNKRVVRAKILAGSVLGLVLAPNLYSMSVESEEKLDRAIQETVAWREMVDTTSWLESEGQRIIAVEAISAWAKTISPSEEVGNVVSGLIRYVGMSDEFIRDPEFD